MLFVSYGIKDCAHLIHNIHLLMSQPEWSSSEGDGGGVEVGGVAEELANVGTDAVGEGLDGGWGVGDLGESLHHNLGNVVSNGGHLEDLLKEGVNHVSDLAAVSIVAVGQVIINSFVILAPVGDEEKYFLDVDDLISPVEGSVVPVAEHSDNECLCLVSEALSWVHVVGVLVHANFVACDKTAGDGGHVLHLLGEHGGLVACGLLQGRYLVAISGILGESNKGGHGQNEGGFHFIFYVGFEL